MERWMGFSSIGRVRNLPRALLLTLGFAAGVTPASAERSGPRLVALMHENLASVNQIAEAVAREDYARVAQEASILRANAESMQDLDLASLGLDASRDSQFDEYLAAQARVAAKIASAAGRRQAGDVLVGIEEVFDSACVACHETFRETDEGRTTPVLFMRTLLSSIQGINRGIAMNDFALVAREAREIGAMAHVFSWSQVIEGIFPVSDPAEKTEFRGYFETLSAQASQVEGAALKRDGALIARSTRRMMVEGCVACHTKFRETVAARSRRPPTAPSAP